MLYEIDIFTDVKYNGVMKGETGNEGGDFGIWSRAKLNEREEEIKPGFFVLTDRGPYTGISSQMLYR